MSEGSGHLDSGAKRTMSENDNFDNLHKADHDLMLRLRNTFYLYINSK